MSIAMTRARADAESRLSDEKKIIEKRRTIIVLCARFFQDLGYLNAVTAIQNDTNMSLDKIDAADNIDLTTILTEYEDFYEMRFGRKPKLTRKVAGDSDNKKDIDRKCSLPRLPPEGTSAQTASYGNVEGGGGSGGKKRDSSKRAKSQDVERRSDRPPLPGEGIAAEGKGEKGDKGLALDGLVVGQNVAKVAAIPKPESKDKEEVAGDEIYDNKLLKALPTTGMDKEYRELAMGIQRDILTKNPGVSWDSIVGLSHAKALLKEAVVMPLKYPQLFTGLLAPWKGVLLFGPPGTGKTLLAKAVATECETTFFNISASTVVSKWRGDSEKLVRVLFDLAKFHQPSTIFIDELDSLMSARGGGDSEHEGSRRMKTELLIQMDGLLRDTQDQVFLLAASNLPWDLDSAMLRRLEKRVLVNLPSPQAREAMFRASLPEGFAESLDYKRLSGLTEEWSGSDIRLLCKEAAMHPLRRLMADIEKAEATPAQDARSNRRKAADKASGKADAVAAAIAELKIGAVTDADVERALQTVHRAPAAHLDKYVDWQEQFGAA
mmetsp:Transcript_148734/g.477653  ORF Transcript_148734/g.477653 Transcript_148734/m.477653 type:complete len:549 (-) Transcript_148734:21-1667(-)